jgi:predicted PurR-regulated permease PerM
MRLPKFKPSPIHEVHVQDNDSPWRWGILISAALVVLGVGVRAAGDILAPVFLAVNLVITAYPLQDWLRRRRLPSWMASLIALVAVYAILAGILGAVAYSIAKLATVIPDYSQQFQDLYNRVIARLTRTSCARFSGSWMSPTSPVSRGPCSAHSAAGCRFCFSSSR